MPPTIYILCHNNARQMLQYDTGTGRFAILQCDETCPCDSFAHGSYIVHDNSVIAIIPSVQGPLLLLGDQRYSLVEQKISFELGDAEEGYINTFKVIQDGQEIYATEYERPYSNSGYLSYTGPEDVDFFYWVNQGFRSPESIRFYTLSQGQGAEAETTGVPMPAMPPAEPGDSRIRWPLLRHAYPWYLQLFALATCCAWVFSFKPAWSYLSAAVNLTRGEFYLERGKYGLAIVELTQALVEVPSAKKATIALAEALFRNKNYMLGLGVLNGVELEGRDWTRIKAALPESYWGQFDEVKKK